jgi:hypothetical protein
MNKSQSDESVESVEKGKQVVRLYFVVYQFLWLIVRKYALQLAA